MELLFGCRGFVGWLFFGPGIAKSRPGKSSQRGGGVLPANFFKVGFEFVVLCGGDGTRCHMTGFIVAVNKAFFADVPADAHAGVFVPHGMIPRAFSCEITFPNHAFFHEEIVDGGEVFDDAFPFDFLRLPFLHAHLFTLLPWQNSGYCCWIFWEGG
jgi:hypothetical protein